MSSGIREGEAMYYVADFYRRGKAINDLACGVKKGLDRNPYNLYSLLSEIKNEI